MGSAHQLPVPNSILMLLSDLEHSGDKKGDFFSSLLPRFSQTNTAVRQALQFSLVDCEEEMCGVNGQVHLISAC